MIEINWANDEQTIIVGKLQKGWTFQTINDSLSEIYDLVDSVEHETYVILDFLDAGKIPSGSISNFKAVASTIHPRVKMYINVSNSMLVETLTNVFTSIHRQNNRARVVKTLEEAYALIEADMKKSAT